MFAAVRKYVNTPPAGSEALEKLLLSAPWIKQPLIALICDSHAMHTKGLAEVSR